MHRLLERLDGMLANIVILLYLGGLGVGTIAYFTGIVSLERAALIAFGGIAIAVEGHSWLMQRRSWGAFQSWMDGRKRHVDDEVLAERRQTFWATLGIFLLVLAVSCFTSILYTAAYWHPSSTLMPAQLQVIVRGLMIPLLFALTVMLVTLFADPADQLARAERRMLEKTLQKIVQQWDKRQASAFRSGQNLAPIAITLMEDAGNHDGARRIRLIDAGLAATEGRSATSAFETNEVLADLRASQAAMRATVAASTSNAPSGAFGPMGSSAHVSKGLSPVAPSPEPEPAYDEEGYDGWSGELAAMNMPTNGQNGYQPQAQQAQAHTSAVSRAAGRAGRVYGSSYDVTTVTEDRHRLVATPLMAGATAIAARPEGIADRSDRSDRSGGPATLVRPAKPRSDIGLNNAHKATRFQRLKDAGHRILDEMGGMVSTRQFHRYLADATGEDIRRETAVKVFQEVAHERDLAAKELPEDVQDEIAAEMLAAHGRSTVAIPQRELQDSVERARVHEFVQRARAELPRRAMGDFEEDD